MVRVASLFSQLLREVPREEFVGLVQKHRAERFAKGFTCWTQLIAMLFSQLARADSLREICNGLACCLGKLTHLGIDVAPRRSTLSYANCHRPAALFEELFWNTLDRFRSRGMLAEQKPFRFKNRLLSLDSTTISLCLSLFPWAKFRTLKGGVKLHVLLSHDDYLPEYLLITKAHQADVRCARQFKLSPGSIVVLDRAYIDYNLLADWSRAGVFWVTRTKTNLELIGSTKREVRPNRPTGHRAHFAPEIPCPASQRDRLGRAESARDQPAHQHHRLRRHHHRRHLQGALEDRTLLQSPQTEPQDQDIRRNH